MPLSSVTKGCCIIGCCTRSGCSKTPCVSLHRFPKDPRIRQSWIKAIGRDGWSPSRYSMVCSLHFIETDFHGTGKIRQLKPTAVPTLNDRSCRYKWRRVVNRCSGNRSRLSVPCSNHCAHHHKIQYYHFTAPKMFNEVQDSEGDTLCQDQVLPQNTTGNGRVFLCSTKKESPASSYCNSSELIVTNVPSVRADFFEAVSQSDTSVEKTDFFESVQPTKNKIEIIRKDGTPDYESPSLKTLSPADVIFDEDEASDNESQSLKALSLEDMIFDEDETIENESPNVNKSTPSDVIFNEDETIDNEYQSVKELRPADVIFDEEATTEDQWSSVNKSRPANAISNEDETIDNESPSAKKLRPADVTYEEDETTECQMPNVNKLRQENIFNEDKTIDNESPIGKKLRPANVILAKDKNRQCEESLNKPCSTCSVGGALSNIRIMYSKLHENGKEPIDEKEIYPISVKRIVRTLPSTSFSSDTCDGLLSDIQIIETPFKKTDQDMNDKSILVLPKEIIEKLPVDVLNIENEENSRLLDIQDKVPKLSVGREISLTENSQLKEADYCTPPRSIKDKQAEPSESETFKSIQTIKKHYENLADENLHKKLVDLETEVRRLRACRLKSQKKIKFLLVQNRRQEKVITVLKNFAMLKSQSNNEKSKLLSDAPSLFRDILERIRGKRSRKVLPNVCSTQLSEFVNTLHSISPDAYNYLQKTFAFCLPHPKIPNTWNSDDKKHIRNTKYSDKPDLIDEDNGESENNEMDATRKRSCEALSFTEEESDNFHNSVSELESDDEHSHFLQNSTSESNLLCDQNRKDCLGQNAVIENFQTDNASEEEYDSEEGYYSKRNVSPLG